MHGLLTHPRSLQGSVLGSYLDPLADKVLITCTVGALAWKARPWLRLWCLNVCSMPHLAGLRVLAAGLHAAAEAQLVHDMLHAACT